MVSKAEHRARAGGPSKFDPTKNLPTAYKEQFKETRAATRARHRAKGEFDRKVPRPEGRRKPPELVMEPEEMTPAVRRSLPAANTGLRLLNPQGKDLEDYEEEAAKQTTRLRYQRMRGHMEMAAQALAMGTTQRMAAKYAGVTERQIKKYYANPDFRTRIEELRAVLTSKLRGKILHELDRRTKPGMIKNMDLLDLLRILDRLAAGGKGAKIEIGEMNIEQNNYDKILQQIFNSDARSQGEDFQLLGDPGPSLADPGSQE